MGTCKGIIALVALLGGLWCSVAAFAADPADRYRFDDSPLKEDIVHPDWFKLSFLNLREDLREAARAGKQGLIVYFGQRRCPYCLKLLEDNFARRDIAAYTRANFDVIPINVRGGEQVTDMRGRRLSEAEFAQREDARFTPSLLFYDSNGREVMRLRGYYPPYQFRAALEFVADQHYLIESFRDYLERGGYLAYELDELLPEPFFMTPPYVLDRRGAAAERPLVVFFEQGNCHACDVLHAETLTEPRVLELLKQLDTVQLHIWRDTPLITPDGQRLTARQWAEQLELFYTPTLIFYDRHGEEIIRLDSVARFHRLRGVLQYVLEEGYKTHPNYLLWRANRRQDGDGP